MAEDYRARLEARRRVTARCVATGDRISNLRLAVAVLILVTLWLVFGTPGLPHAWLVVPIVLFVALVVRHERVARRRELSVRAEGFYERGLRRLNDEWRGTGEKGERYRDPEHPFEEDLDVFGEGSLFELLCAARTRSGRDALASWLAAPAEVEEARARQTAVKELRPRLDLREEIALLGDEIPVGIDAASLAEWGRRERRLTAPLVPIAAAFLGALSIAALVLWFVTDLGPGPLALMALLDVLFFLPFRARVMEVTQAANRPSEELDLLSLVLARFEAESFESPLLARLRGALDTDGRPPSRRIRSLVRKIQLVDAARNQLFMPIAWLLLWDLQAAYAIERWRAANGASVGRWVEAVGEIEALLSLAGHSFERPDDPFPEFSEEGPELLAEGIGHPLLPEGRLVRNDVRLGGDLRLLVVSGSNMSGKSTLLRTLGANTVLAFAGAPVRARSLRLSRLMPAASIRISDSLLDGASRFFAEIRRLKLVVDLAGGDPPALFLLDELLHGTNSKDRAAGAEALVKGLVKRGSIGLVTTHDLALGEIAESLAPRAANVHFEDRLEKGEMAFDYLLRPGVVTRSNALALMRAVGLDV